MRLHEEFQLGEPVTTVWRFFEQPRLVAGCLPGVEAIEIIDDDNVTVRVTQKADLRMTTCGPRAGMLGSRHEPWRPSAMTA